MPKKKSGAGLLALFETQRKDGSYLYTDEAVRALVPLLFLASGEDLSQQAPKLQRLMAEFFAKVGLKPRATAKQLQQAVDRYYAEHPVDPKLLKKLQQTLRG
ncbi:MAG: hypothetical protein H6Q89_1239 [Myxococcaceae bacterium]|nr:hypothetical protein [Myxococcaceae bacterium]